MNQFTYINTKNGNDDIFILWIRQQQIHHYQHLQISHPAHISSRIFFPIPSLNSLQVSLYTQNYF